MATFLAQIQSYIGTFSDTSFLDEVLTAGARIIVNRLKEADLEKYSADVTDAGSGIDITTHRLINAHKSNRGARRVNSYLAAAIVDTDSIHYAITTDPAWYVLNGKGYVKPSGGTLIGMAYPTVVNTDSTITKFPIHYEIAVVLYTAIQALLQNINTLIKTTLGGLTYSAPTNVTPPAAPAFTYTDASYTDSLYSDASYTAAEYIDALVDTISTVTISSLITAPSYNMPVFGGNFSTVTTPLDTNLDAELAGAHLSRLDRYLNEYQSEIQNELNKFNEGSTEYQADIQYKIEQARIDLQRLTEQTRLQVEANLRNAKATIDTALQNASKSADIDAMNKAKALEVDITNKSKNLELDIINKSKDLEKQIQEYQAKLGKYGIDTQDYSAQVNEEVSRIQILISRDTAQYQGTFKQLENLNQEYQRILETI